VSRYGVIAMGSSLDSPGVLSKDVAGAARVLKIIAGKDSKDATTSDNEVPDYELSLTGDIKDLKIGVIENYFLSEMDKEVVKKTLDTVEVFQKLGAKVSNIKTLDPKYAIGVYTVVQRSEVSSNLARYDGIRYGKDYKKAQAIRTLFINDFEKLLKSFDVLIGPTMPGPAPKLGATKGQAMFGEMADILAEPAAISGLPAVSVPCGFVGGLPIGLQIIAPQFSEDKILNVAYAYETSNRA